MGERAMSRQELDELQGHVDDRFVRGALRAAYHVRRYQPFYVFTLVWAVMLVVFPSVNPLNTGSDSGYQGYSGDASRGGAYGSGSETASAGGVDTQVKGATAVASGKPGGGGGGAKASGGGTSTTPTSFKPAGAQAGQTRAGDECKEGVRQIPWSDYAAPCVEAFQGDNGGATARGVTAEEIVIVERRYPTSPNEQAMDAILEQSGFASDEEREAVADVFLEYFNNTFELYGRTVKRIVYESENGDETTEMQSKGKEGACLDADKIANEFNAFGVGGGTSFGPFSECAAERQTVVFNGGWYFPETWYREYHPYIYNTLMECERISYQVAEYAAKRLAGKKATWAKDPLYQMRERTFATYIPDNDEYLLCNDLARKELREKYGLEDGPRFTYVLDISRFPDQAAQAVVQFKSQNISTIVLACDYFSIIFLTNAAASQNWGPEWLLIGTTAQDTDNAARLYNQDIVDGHMFGMSQLGDITKAIGPTSEPGITYQNITGQEIPAGTSGDYFTWLQMFNGLQAAGPNLTAENVFNGYCSLPPAGLQTGAVGLAFFGTNPDGSKGCDHTAVDDSREVYWVGDAEAPDGEAGHYIETYGGKRFTNGQWPREDPPVYPDGA